MCAALSSFARGLNAIEAGNACWELSQRKARTTLQEVEMGASALLVAIEGLNLVSDLRLLGQHLPGPWRLVTAIVALALDIARTGAHELANPEENNTEELLARLAVRVADVGLGMIPVFRTLRAYEEGIHAFSHLASAAPLAIAGGRVIRNRFQSSSHAERVEARAVDLLSRIEEALARESTNSGERVGLQMILPDLRDVYQLDDEEIEAAYEETVGKIWTSHPTCVLTGRPIQQILVSGSDPELYFERPTLEKWLREQPEQAPPGWPVDQLPLPLNRSYFISHPALQRQVRQDWERHIRGLMESLESRRSNRTM
jgi:hypothetical protein